MQLTSVVERGKVEKPAIGVPGPACNGTVDDGAPAKGENEGRHDTATLERATDDDLYCASGEEKLVKAEDDFREDGAAGGWGGCDFSQAKVGEVTNKRVGSTGEGKRVTPLRAKVQSVSVSEEHLVLGLTKIH